MPIPAKVRRIGCAGFVACLATMALGVRPSQAVVCPDGEPDFVYNDVGSDGCFNIGVDQQISDASLFAASYSPAVGGIVVPQRVTVAPPMGTPLTWNGADTLFVRGVIEASDAIFLSGDAIEVETKAEILGTSVTLNMNNNVIVGDGAKLTATTGQLLISQGGTCTVGLGARLTGFSMSLSSSDSLVIGEGSDIEATGSTISIGSGVDVELQSDVAVVALSDITISNTGKRTVGDKVRLTAGGSVLLGGGDTTTIGEGLKVNANSIYINGSYVTAGEKLSLVSGISIAVIGDGVQLSDKAKLTSASYIYLTANTGLVSLGKAKLTAGDDISLSGANAVVLQYKVKMTTQGDLYLTGVDGVNIGANCSLSAGEDIDVYSSSPAPLLGSIYIQKAVKLTSGTLEDPMTPSLIRLRGASIILEGKDSLRGADLNNSIVLDPLSSLDVNESKFAAKTITLGDDANAPFATFEFTDTQAKGTADGSTFTIHAPGTACNVTDSTFKDLTLDFTSCASVVGP